MLFTLLRLCLLGCCVSPIILKAQKASNTVVAGQLLQKAREQRLQGTVRFHAIIGKDGSIHSLHLEQGVCSLAEAAFDAVRQWRYTPTLLKGQPLEYTQPLTLFSRSSTETNSQRATRLIYKLARYQ